MSAAHLSPPTAIARHAVLLVTSALILVPFVWMVSLSLKPPGEMFRSSFSLLPEHWDVVENYTKALTGAPLPRYMLNGVIVCAAILALQILVCAPCAYALAKLRFKGRDLLFVLVLIGLLLPHQVLALPLFILGYQLGILNTYAALVFPFVVSPFGIFLFRQFFKSIPDDVVHAARLDGLRTRHVWRIMVPMALLAVIAFAIFRRQPLERSVLAHHRRARGKPHAPPRHHGFQERGGRKRLRPLMAAVTLVVLPLIIAFLAAQMVVDGFGGKR